MSPPIFKMHLPIGTPINICGVRVIVVDYDSNTHLVVGWYDFYSKYQEMKVDIKYLDL